MPSHQSYMNTWLLSLQHGVFNGRPYSDHSVGLYRYQMSWFFQHFDEVSVANFKQCLLIIPIERFGKRRKLFEAVCCFTRFLIQEGVFPEVIIEQLKPFKPKRHLPPKKISLTEAEIEKLLQACESPLDTFIIRFLSQTGLRASEAANLQLSDLDLEKGFVTITRAKWGKSRRVGLTNAAIEAIQTFLPLRQFTYNPSVMTKINGKPMDRGGILTRIERISKKAGLKANAHALRRAFVTINANKGRPLPMLQIACGHSDITTTRSYCMTTEDETIEAMKGWD